MVEWSKEERKKERKKEEEEEEKKQSGMNDLIVTSQENGFHVFDFCTNLPL